MLSLTAASNGDSMLNHDSELQILTETDALYGLTKKTRPKWAKKRGTARLKGGVEYIQNANKRVRHCSLLSVGVDHSDKCCSILSQSIMALPSSSVQNETVLRFGYIPSAEFLEGNIRSGYPSWQAT